MSKITELEDIIAQLKKENEVLKQKISKLEYYNQPRCSGCGDILDGPHHSFCGEREFG